MHIQQYFQQFHLRSYRCCSFKESAWLECNVQTSDNGRSRQTKQKKIRLDHYCGEPAARRLNVQFWMCIECIVSVVWGSIKVKIFKTDQCSECRVKTMSTNFSLFGAGSTISIISGWYPTKGRSNVADNVYLINLICIDSLGLYAKAPPALWAKSSGFQSGTWSTGGGRKTVSESGRNNEAFSSVQKTDETGKIQPCGILGGEDVLYLTFVSVAQTRQGQC